MKLVIVESPAKAQTINKYLGNDYKVIASVGHVRDLPSKDGAVLPEDNFKMSWEMHKDKEKVVKEIISELKAADTLILATDPDREGEAISWHLKEILNSKKTIQDKPVQRVVFNEITKNAVLEAMKIPREINTELVEAYLARRALDHLIGFSISPILWRKLPGSKSAGRVQSVALKLICEREIEIEKFNIEEYWSISSVFEKNNKEDFTARLVFINKQKLAKMDIKNENEAIKLKNDSPYGLTASIWTNDIDIAEKIGNQVQTGTFYMNRCDYLDPALSWTGVKETGKGCSLSEIAYEKLTAPKSFHLRKEQ